MVKSSIYSYLNVDTSHPPDVINVIGVPRPSPFFCHSTAFANRTIKNVGALGTKLCYPSKNKTSVDSHCLFMSTAPTLDSGVEGQEGGCRVE